MSNYNFTNVECKFIRPFLDMVLGHQKIVYWKEYGATEWYIMFESTLYGKRIQIPIMKKVNLATRKIVLMMIKLGLLVPEIEDDKEYKMQRALGIVIGRIYYMPEKVCEELEKSEVMYI